MNFSRLRRLPNRLKQDLKIIRIAENWKTILKAKARNEPYLFIKMRNGVTLSSPAEVSLNFLFHEIWVEEFYSAPGYEIADNETIVDIGGNIGVFAMWAATRAKNVNVHSYEPFPSNADYFLANRSASKLDNIAFYPFAVGDSDGTRKLQVEDSWILHSLAAKASDDGAIDVRCVSLDSILGEIDKCDFLKLDCEGSEYEIIYGADDRSLSKIQRIICEYNLFDGADRNGQALANYLVRKGFTIDKLAMLDENSGVLKARKLT